MDIVSEAAISEEVCGGLLGCGAVFFFPLCNWWRSLGPQTKAKIPLVISSIIATSDIGLDYYVLVDWYGQGLSKIATALLFCILVSGTKFCLTWVT